MTPLLLATENNNTEVSALMVEKGADINAKDHVDRKLLFAANMNNTEACVLLIEKGADINVKNSYGDTVIMRYVSCSSPADAMSTCRIRMVGPR
jgi:ankyrin repeat protein